MPDLRADLAERLQYFDGHSDTLGLFADGARLARARDDAARTAARDPRGGARARRRRLGRVDQLPDDVREQMQPVARVALAAELRPA
jgi:hypothetical protein